MQRAYLFCMAASLWSSSVHGQAVSAADLAAVRAELAEDNKLVRTDFNSLEQRVEILAKNVQQLSDALRRTEAENRSLREAISKATVGLTTRKELEQVLEQLKEVDKKRVDDGKAIRDSLGHLGEQLDKIGRLAATPAPVSPSVTEDRRKPNRDPERSPSTSTPPRNDETELPSEFYEHVVQERETLGMIIAAYNKEHNLKIRMNDVLKANPRLKDPKKIFVGMKLRIPAVK